MARKAIAHVPTIKIFIAKLRPSNLSMYDLVIEEVLLESIQLC